MNHLVTYGTRHSSLRLFGLLALSSVFLSAATAEVPVPQSIVDQTPDAESKTAERAFSDVLIAAHRGGYENDKADNAPENTVANIHNCVRQGYPYFETDIQRTADGHFVIVHDATIDRETTGTGVVSEMTLSELRKLRKRFRDGSVSEHRVATLGEFLAAGKNRVIFKADLKPGVNQYFADVIKVVQRHDAIDGIVFRVPFRDADLYSDYRSSGGTYTSSLLMFMVGSKSQLDEIKNRFDPSTIQINLKKVNPASPKALQLIRDAAGLGLLVETHAEGTQQAWQKLIRAGVGMFHTRSPAKLKAFLDQAGSEN